ncbi:hypothetical protein MRX96_025783 [Rhipicephalus microplus]
MGNVISAASEDASDGGTSRLVAATESSATAVDAATTGLPEQTSQDEAPDASEAPLDRLYPSTETFGEQAGWSSPRERESDTALVLSASCTPEEKVAPCTPRRRAPPKRRSPAHFGDAFIVGCHANPDVTRVAVVAFGRGTAASDPSRVRRRQSTSRDGAPP